MSDEPRPSAPMSPLPPPEEQHPHRRRSDSIAGWVPGDDDESPRAQSWRGRKALRVALRTEDAQRKLATSIEGLTATIDTWSTTWAARWKTAGRVLLVIGTPVVIAGAVGVATWAWHFVSTLHH